MTASLQKTGFTVGSFVLRDSGYAQKYIKYIRNVLVEYRCEFWHAEPGLAIMVMVRNTVNISIKVDSGTVPKTENNLLRFKGGMAV